MESRAIFIYGPPGAGKGTILERLAREFKQFKHLSSGDLVREWLKADGPEQREYLEQYKRGVLLGDEQLCKIVTQSRDALIKRTEYKPSFQYLMPDGFPRTHRQAELLEWLNVTECIRLYGVPRETLETRIIGRAENEVAQGRKPRLDDINPAARQKRIAEYPLQLAASRFYKARGAPETCINVDCGKDETYLRIVRHLHAQRFI